MMDPRAAANLAVPARKTSTRRRWAQPVPMISTRGAGTQSTRCSHWMRPVSPKCWPRRFWSPTSAAKSYRPSPTSIWTNSDANLATRRSPWKWSPPSCRIATQFKPSAQLSSPAARWASDRPSFPPSRESWTRPTWPRKRVLRSLSSNRILWRRWWTVIRGRSERYKIHLISAIMYASPEPATSKSTITCNNKAMSNSTAASTTTRSFRSNSTRPYPSSTQMPITPPSLANTTPNRMLRWTKQRLWDRPRRTCPMLVRLAKTWGCWPNSRPKSLRGQAKIAPVRSRPGRRKSTAISASEVPGDACRVRMTQRWVGVGVGEAHTAN